LDISVFFKPSNRDTISEGYVYQTNQLGKTIKKFEDPESFPSLDGCLIAIIGVKEGRGSKYNESCDNGPDVIRKHLYKLWGLGNLFQIVDLGNIEPGHTIEDTYYALSSTIEYLVKLNILPVIIGGGQDLTFANYKGYQNLEQLVNLVSIDNNFNLGFIDDDLDAQTYLSKIILYQPNYLFNYSNVGYQTYFVDPAAVELMQKLFFDSYRLGLVRANMEQTEPIVRNADIVSFDISSVRKGDAPGNFYAGPNGFSGEEFCQIARYAGLSDKVSSVGFYEYNPEFDNRESTAHLISQAIWCFLEGVSQRKNDIPSSLDNNFLKYRVFLSDSKHEIVFYKSNKSDRWWMEVPYPNNKSKYERHHLVPCSYADYQTACNEGMPDRWWQTYQKLI
jgi:arginase family enzyme